MTISKCDIDGLLIIKPDVFKDDRGYFFESYNQEKLNKLGFNENFVQDNVSRSAFGTIRGLHYQIGEFAQGKLCQVLYGKVLDVAVDLRYGSPTYAKHYALELSDENNLQFWIPPGFAHGFAVLSEFAIFSYKCTQFYSKEFERAIRYNDPNLNINWMVERPILSNKDLNAPLFNPDNKDFIYKNLGENL